MRRQKLNKIYPRLQGHRYDIPERIQRGRLWRYQPRDRLYIRIGGRYSRVKELYYLHAIDKDSGCCQRTKAYILGSCYRCIDLGKPSHLLIHRHIRYRHMRLKRHTAGVAVERSVHIGHTRIDPK